MSKIQSVCWEGGPARIAGVSGWQEVDTLLALRLGSLRACRQRLGEQEAFGSAMLET